VNEYYKYIIKLVQIVLAGNNLNQNFVIGGRHILTNENRIIIKINYEHTLVLPGGRDSKNAFTGNISFDEKTKYLVRIDDYDNLNQSNIVIDYSLPNIENIIQSKIYETFAKKLIYIAPYLYEPYIISTDRKTNILTTFININEPRRKKLIQEISKYKLSHQNINDCFDGDNLMKILKNTKLLINIHQTDHHHTFEELRVLPALLCGVIVICEESPLKNIIPYHSYIIWSKYENMIENIIYVQNNYYELFEKIFIKSNFKSYIEKLHLTNLLKLKEKIL
jgi:hypothetical protein